MDIVELHIDETMNEDSNINDSTVPISIYAVVLYVGVCTNIWLLVSLYKSWKNGSRVHFHLLALCISDFLVLATHWPIIGNWEGGNVGCKMLASLKPSTAIFAHLILAGFNIDNAVTIWFKRSYKAIRIMFVIVAVTVSLCIMILAIFIFKHGVGERYSVCYMHTTPIVARLHEIGSLIGIYFLPIVLMVSFGGLALGLFLRSRGQGIRKPDDYDDDMDNIGQGIIKASAFDLLFFLCWTPFAVIHFIFLVSTDIFNEPYLQLIYLVIDFLASTCSCLLPLINGLCNYLIRKSQLGASG